MSNFFNNLRYKFARWMQGRYGADKFTRFLSFLLLGLVIINLFVRSGALSLLAWAVIIYMYFRVFSKNISKRYQENQKYLALEARVRNFFSGITDPAKRAKNREQRKNYHIYKCPQCKQKIRIPRGKGMIMVKCPKCGNEFKKKS